MFVRIALLLGVLCVPVLLALASQALAESTEPPQMPEPVSTAVADVPAGAPGRPAGQAPAGQQPAPAGQPQQAPAGQEPAGQAPGGQPGPQVVQIDPRPVGAPADLDGDRDDDGVPDEEDTDETPPTAPDGDGADDGDEVDR